jgi:hypothetical protein
LKRGFKEGPLLGTPKDMLNKALEMGVCFHKCPVMGTWGEDAFLEPSREWWSFFNRKFYWGVREKCKRRLWKRANLSIRAPVGEFGGGSFIGTFERHLKEGCPQCVVKDRIILKANVINLFVSSFIFCFLVPFTELFGHTSYTSLFGVCPDCCVVSVLAPMYPQP